jgi:pyruvate dehydrogenase E1 component
MPAMPTGSREGILAGLYRYRSTGGQHAGRVKLLGSGPILNQVLAAQQRLHADWGVESEVWAATSYQQLHREALAVERRNRLASDGRRGVPYVASCLGDDPDTLVVAASDWVKALPCSIAPWVPGPFVALGTDGFGRSDGRAALRDYFEVDARHVAWAVLEALGRQRKLAGAQVERARAALEIDPGKPDPTAL